MKPQDVRYHHIRDHPWPQKWCAKCGRTVPTFHRHWKKDKDDKFAMPRVVKDNEPLTGCWK